MQIKSRDTTSHPLTRKSLTTPSVGEDVGYPELPYAAYRRLTASENGLAVSLKTYHPHGPVFNKNTHTQDLEKDAQGSFIHNSQNLGTTEYP